MLSKENKLSRELFETLLKNGKRLHSPLFTLIFFPSADKKTRFSCVVSKKIAKTAVKRNNLRRKAYSSLRNILSSIQNPILGAFIAKPPATISTIGGIGADLASLLQKAGVLDKMSR